MKSNITISILCAITCFLLCGCSYLKDKGLVSSTIPASGEGNEIQAVKEDELLNVKEAILKQALSFGDMFTEWTVDGSLIYTIQDAYIVTNIYDERIKTDGIETYPTAWDEETGDILNDSYFLIVDVMAQNESASSTQYSDPYVFTSGFYLCDMGSAIGAISDFKDLDDLDLQLEYKNYTYFSLLNERTEHRFAYYCAPGDTVSFQIGFFIEDSSIEKSDFILSNMSGTLGGEKTVYLNLNLTDN